MTANLKKAIEIAHFAHEGQVRFDGTPYINHPLRVMRIVELQGHSDRAQKVAVLHDAPEDSLVTFDSLREEGFEDDVIFPLELLTKKKGADYDRYIKRLGFNACSRAVKKADLFDNMDLTGLDNPSLARILNIEKYAKALMELSSHTQRRV